MLKTIPVLFIVFYYFFLVFSYVVNLKLTKNQFRILNLIFLINIGIVAYNFVPQLDMDLTRYYAMLDEVENLPFNWNQFVNYGPYRNTIITSIYFNYFSKIDNRSWFVVFPTLVVFIFTIWSANKFMTKYNVSFRAFAFFMIAIISVSSYTLIITGVRQDVAWSFLMIAVYYDFFKENRNSVIGMILYLIPLGIHTSAFPIVLLRLLAIIIQYVPSLKYLLLLWPTSLIFTRFFDGVLPGALNFPLQILKRYLEDISNYQIQAQDLVTFVSYFIVLYLLYYISNYNLRFEYISRKYLNFYTMIVLFGLSSFFVPTLLSRTFELVLYISLPLMDNMIKINSAFTKILLLVMLLMFIVLFYWQDLLNGYMFLF